MAPNVLQRCEIHFQTLRMFISDRTDVIWTSKNYISDIWTFILTRKKCILDIRITYSVELINVKMACHTSAWFWLSVSLRNGFGSKKNKEKQTIFSAGLNKNNMENRTRTFYSKASVQLFFLWVNNQNRAEPHWDVLMGKSTSSEPSLVPLNHQNWSGSEQPELLLMKLLIGLSSAFILHLDLRGSGSRWPIWSWS